MNRFTKRQMMRTITAIFVGVLVICGIVKGKKIQTERQWLKNVIQREKRWILENQGDDGEIYMNGSRAGDVNPYFSCQAALGLLAYVPTYAVENEELEAVRRYLEWHTRILIETDGKMGIYRKQDDNLLYVEKADSVDAYLGVYLELLGNYLRMAGTDEGLDEWTDGVQLAIEKLQILTVDGVAQVSEENTTRYLMDNLEVWKGLKTLETCLSDGGVSFEKTLNDKTKKIISIMCGRSEKKISEVFWSEKRQKWRIIAENDSFDEYEFYPDGIAQIFPLIVGFRSQDDKGQKRLYREFTEKFNWQSMNNKTFVWANIGMAAAEVKDGKGLKRFIKGYEETYSFSRKYPLYTGEAGWICRECAMLYRNIW